MSLPFSFRVGDLNAQFFDDDGEPLAGGFVQFLDAGTEDEKDTYSDPDSSDPTVNPNPVPLDSAGRAAIYLGPGSYDVIVMDSDEVELRTIEGVEDIALTFLSTLGQQMAEGDRDVTDGYEVLATDITITVDTSAGAVEVLLPAVADRGQDLTIINLDTDIVTVTPNGAETINFVAASYEIAVSASPALSSITLRPDGSTNWLVIAEIIA